MYKNIVNCKISAKSYTTLALLLFANMGLDTNLLTADVELFDRL